MTVQFTMHLPIKITKQEKWFLASCPILDVHSQGHTEEKARKNIEEALSLFFISCFERGTLAAVLKDRGFQPLHLPPDNQKIAAADEDYIDVPIPFLINQTTSSQCHA